MSRVRTLVSFTVVLDEWSVGTGEPDTLAPAPTVTGLLGDLRDHLAFRLGAAGADALLGAAVGAGNPAPSRLAAHAVTMVTGPTHTEQRQRTAVDGFTRAAETQRLFPDRWCVGGELRLLATVAGELRPAEREALASWAPRVGSGYSTDRGAARLTELRSAELDVAVGADWDLWAEHSLEDILDFAVPADRWISLPVAAEPRLLPLPGWPAVELTVVDGVLPQPVPGPPPGHQEGQNHLRPGARDGDGRVRLDGEHLKGVLRARVEYLLATAGAPSCRPERDGPCGRCLACHLFGDLTGAARIVVEPAFLRDQTSMVLWHNQTDHVTGQVLQLFSEQVFFGRLTLPLAHDPRRSPSPESLDLFARVLLDLHEGWFGVGHAATRQGHLALVDPGTVEFLRARAEPDRLRAALSPAG
jgi:hypothetical protein